MRIIIAKNSRSEDAKYFNSYKTYLDAYKYLNLLNKTSQTKL